MPDRANNQSERAYGFRNLSFRGVGSMLLQATKDLINDSGFQWAAAVAYYSLLSVFPLLLATAAVASYFVDPQWAIEQLTGMLNSFVPQGSNKIGEIVKTALEARGTISFLSFLTLLWTGTRVFGALTLALNIAFDVDEMYSFFRRLLVEAVMLFTIGLFFVLAVSSRFLINILWSTLQILPGGEGVIFQVVSSIVPAILLLVAFFLIYRFVPRERPHWRAALVGSFVAMALFLLARPLFLGYINRFAEYSQIYGSVGIVVILIFWAWIVAVITLFGGEIASHTQDMLIEGQTAQEVDAKHRARSPSRKLKPASESQEQVTQAEGTGDQRRSRSQQQSSRQT